MADQDTKFPRQLSATFSLDINSKPRTWLYYIDVNDGGKLKYLASDDTAAKEEEDGPPYQALAIRDANNNYVYADKSYTSLAAVTFALADGIRTNLYFRTPEGRLRELCWIASNKNRWTEGGLSNFSQRLAKAEVTAVFASQQLKIFYIPEDSTTPYVYWYDLSSDQKWHKRPVLGN